MKMNYAQQIKHPLWQKKRLEVLELHSFQCQKCKAKESELHVHHPFYRSGAMIWEYGKEELECLCYKCHKNEHDIDEKIKKALALCQDKDKALAYLLELNGQSVNHPKKTAKVAKKRIVAVVRNPETEQAASYVPTEEEAEKSAEGFWLKMKELMG